VAGTIRVTLAWSPREGEALEKELCLDAGAVLLDAVRAAGLLEGEDGVDVSTQAVGVWGRAAALDSPLVEGDRVEVYRPLRMNPQEARRRRAARR